MTVGSFTIQNMFTGFPHTFFHNCSCFYRINSVFQGADAMNSQALSFDRSVSEFHEHFKIILTSLTPTIRRSIPTSLPTQLCLFLFFSPSRSIHVAQIFLDVWSGALSPYGGYDLRENRSKGVSIKSPLSLQSLSFLPSRRKRTSLPP